MPKRFDSLPEAVDVAEEAVYCSSGYEPRWTVLRRDRNYSAIDLTDVIQKLHGKRSFADALDILHQRFNRFTAWLFRKWS